MSSFGYSTENRGPARDYTPSNSDEDLPQLSGLSLNDKSYRLFSFRKDGRSWVNAVCTESSLSSSDIKKKAKRPRKASHSVEAQLDKMSPPRRNAIEDLLDRTIQKDINGDEWEVVAIDNDKPEWTKRTGEVTAFSVILGKVSLARQRTNSNSQERLRRSTYLPSSQEFVVPGRRGSKSYNQTRTSPTRDSRGVNKQNQSYRNSQSILEQDPFGNAQLFSQDGKPITTSGTAVFNNAGLPPHIQQEEPIGAPPKFKKEKANEGKVKKSKAAKDGDTIDLDALLGLSGLGGNGDLLGGHVLDDHRDVHDIHDDHDDHLDHGFESPIEIFGAHDEGTRGRKQYAKGWGEKTPKGGLSRSKSKSKPRRPSLHIPKDDSRRSIPDVTPGNKRRSQPYWGSHGSATTPSIRSDQSVLEAEYEEYSSSGSSGGGFGGEWQGSYMPNDGRYQKATNYHRAGPPSPQQGRYEPVTVGDRGYIPARRPSRVERYATEGAVTRYGYRGQAQQRPPIISQHSAPRFTPTPTTAYPMSAHPNNQLGSAYPSAYNTLDSALTPFPSEMHTHDSLQQQHAELYMRKEEHNAREMELLKRERDLAIREAEMHQEIARRRSVGRSKYNHEPRLSRAYTEQYNR